MLQSFDAITVIHQNIPSNIYFELHPGKAMSKKSRTMCKTLYLLGNLNLHFLVLDSFFLDQL